MTGALAAMTTWAQVSSLPSFMARPSRSSERDGGAGLLAEPVGAAQRAGQRAQPRLRLQVVDQVGAHDPLGRAVDLGRDHGARHRRAEVELLDGVGHPALGREEEAGPHGHAGGAVGQGGHQAPAAEEAAGAEDQDPVAHGVDDLGEQERRGHGAGVPAPLGPLGDDGVHPPFGHLLGVAPGADRGHDEQPRLLAAGHQGRVGRLGEAGHPGAGLDHELDALVARRPRRCAG